MKHFIAYFPWKKSASKTKSGVVSICLSASEHWFLLLAWAGRRMFTTVASISPEVAVLPSPVTAWLLENGARAAEGMGVVPVDRMFGIAYTAAVNGHIQSSPDKWTEEPVALDHMLKCLPSGRFIRRWDAGTPTRADVTVAQCCAVNDWAGLLIETPSLGVVPRWNHGGVAEDILTGANTRIEELRAVSGVEYPVGEFGGGCTVELDREREWNDADRLVALAFHFRTNEVAALRELGFGLQLAEPAQASQQPVQTASEATQNISA